MKYTRFEELPCWQTARELCKAVFDLIYQREFRKDFGLRNEIWKSAGSVMDNIAEGFDDGSTREFIRFLGLFQKIMWRSAVTVIPSPRLWIHKRGTVQPCL